MKTTKQDVVFFCRLHDVVLPTLTDWRPLDPNYTYSHVFFGDVLDGITDGIVAYTKQVSGSVCFVHLDLLKPTPIPRDRFSRVPAPPRKKLPPRAPHPEPLPLPCERLLDTILAGVEF
jgi:hypothetical protein